VRHRTGARRRRPALKQPLWEGIRGLRGRALLSTFQRRISAYYALDTTLDVTDFVRAVGDHEREALLVREQEDLVEMALLLPQRLLTEDAPTIDADGVLQALEGVSHFVYLTERVRQELPTTQLELELQAEVDKFVFLALTGDRTGHVERSALHRCLFERVRFLHDENTEQGQRYRLANDLAARYVRRFEPGAPSGEVRTELCRFYRAGQSDKIRMACAA
jgi:hypothetical protein